MALAWNAGWVNSPRGFKSRILRRSGATGTAHGCPVAPESPSDKHGRWSESHRRHGLARVSCDIRRLVVLPVRAASVVGAHRLHLACTGHGDADHRGARGRAGGAAGGRHTQTRPATGIRHAAVGADAAQRGDRCPGGRRHVNRRHGDQRDLAVVGQCRDVVVRDLRCRCSDRAPGDRRVLPGFRRRNAAATAQTD